MPLTLTIRNADSLENGSPLSLILDRRGAIIGRAPTADWCLPDPTLHISSRHAEIVFRDGAYVVNDISTNGTFLGNSDARLAGPHTINQGDQFVIGKFEIAASLDDATASSMAARNASPPPPNWKGWGGQDDSAAAPPASASGWGAPPVGSAISGTGPMSQSWAPPAAPESSGWGTAPAAAPAPAVASPPAPPPASGGWGAAPSEPSSVAGPSGSGWGASPASSASVSDVAPSAGPGWGAPPATASTWQDAPTAPPPASGWSSPIPDAAPQKSADDVWGKIAASNVVDWARGGFGTPPPPPPAPASPLGSLGEPAAGAQFGYAQPIEERGKTTPLGAPAAAPAGAPGPVAAPAPAPAAPGAGGLDELLAAAGLDRAALKQGDAETLRQAGHVLRRIVAGLVVMLEARARAKSQMGAQGTSLEFDGNNPLKFARAPEQAILQLLNPPERGFMPADRAIEDSFLDLQTHQMATLKAMQGALRVTLDRFSPTAIKARADQGGVLKKILPGARDAALWAAYEREFGGVAQGSDEAFMDIFAKEFRKAYEESAKKR